MSPTTVERTSVRRTPRAAAMLARPAVRQAARACRTNSTGVGPLSRPTRTAGWSASKWNVRSCERSSPTPKKPSIVLRLWVPLSHSLLARNWNFAASGAALTASSVANRVAVSTPLRMCSLTMAVISGFLLLVVPRGCAGWVDVWRPVGRSRRGEFPVARHRVHGQGGRLGVDGRADLSHQVDERRHGRIGDQGAGEVEDRPEREVAPAFVAAQRGGLVGLAAQ